MVMKWFTVEHSPILVDFGGEYLIRQPPSLCCVYIVTIYIDTAH